MKPKDFLIKKNNNYQELLPKNNSQNIANNPIKIAIKIIIIFAVIFLSWAIFLPIDSASIAQGIVVLDLKRKSIQHRDGGIIDKILVKEGQIVKENDILLKIFDSKTLSEKNILQQQLWTIELQKQRIEAQLENRQKFDFLNYQQYQQDLTEFDKIFLSKISKIQNQIFLNQKKQSENEIKILKNKLKSAKKIFFFLQQESSIIQQLVLENNISIIKQFDLEKSIAQARENIDILELEINNYHQKELINNLNEIKEIDMQIISLSNQLKNTKEQIKRLEIRSPSNGKVMNIKYHNSGAVITPASEIMSIVPQDEELIIEAKINPNDIDNISINSHCKIQFSAFKGKKFPKITGKIIDISADILFDDLKKDSFFLARIKIDNNQISKLKNQLSLNPGMAVTVFIINDSRAFISYLFSPIIDSAYKAFREE